MSPVVEWMESVLKRPLTLREMLEFDQLAYGVAIVDGRGRRVDPKTMIPSPLERLGAST